jgi:ElaB/YqjD/DUF883 family membrane-anchored ribosome-binding protein
MTSVTTSEALLDELRALLDELPFDDEQRVSVLEDAAKLSKQEMWTITQKLSTTLNSLMSTLHEMDEVMDASEIHVVRETTASAAFSISVPEYV